MSADDIDNHLRLMQRTPAGIARYVADGLIKIHNATINDLPRHLRGRLIGHAITLNTLAEDIDTQDTPMSSELEALGRILLDLDRCAHGRHHGDDCGGMYNSTSCPGTSMGNPHMPPGTVIGYWRGGRIVVPTRANKDNPAAWLNRDPYDPRREAGSTVAPLVAGKCPACGGHTLYLAAGGHITCARSACPNPTELNDQINKDTP